MYKYIKVYELGYIEGIKDSIRDIKTNKIKGFKNIDDKEILSKLYDIGYIKGYKKSIKYFKDYLIK